MTQWLQAIRKFNTVALCIVLILAILFATSALVQMWRADESDEWGYPGSRRAGRNEIGGERIDAGSRSLTLYRRSTAIDEFETDLRFVDSRTGQSTTLGNGPAQEMFSGKLMGPLRRGNHNAGYGYLVLAKVGQHDDEPLFDAIFLRFSDMRSFTVASGIRAVDDNELDEKTFSAVVWDKDDRASFILFDVPQGKVTLSRDLGMTGAKQSNPNAVPVDR